MIGVMAHEYQHLIHWGRDPAEESWLNESMSELAMAVLGYEDTANLHAYLQDLHRAWAECRRVVRDGGRLCVNVGDQFARARLFGRYRVIPLHAAAPDPILLASPESGLLLVGSGNLNMTGYARNGECFTPYRWSEDSPDDLSAFGQEIIRAASRQT